LNAEGVHGQKKVGTFGLICQKVAIIMQ